MIIAPKCFGLISSKVPLCPSDISPVNGETGTVAAIYSASGETEEFGNSLKREGMTRFRIRPSGGCKNRLGPGVGAVGGADGGADVAFVALDFVVGRVAFYFGEDFAVLTGECGDGDR